MKYYKHPEFIKSVYELYKKDGRYRKAATKVLAVLAKIQEQGFFSRNEIIHGINKIRNGENRLSSCIKYDIGSGCRLITTKNDNEQVFLFAGTHEDADKWLGNHNNKNFKKIDIRKKESEIAISVTPLENNIDIPTGVNDIVGAAFNNLLEESRINQQKISSRRKEIAELRQEIRINRVTLVGGELKELNKGYNEESEINNAKVNISKHNCPDIIDAVEKVDNFVKENKVKDAFKLLEPIEGNVTLLKLRLKYVQSLESLVGEIKAEIDIENKIHKVAVALDLDFNPVEKNKCKELIKL